MDRRAVATVSVAVLLLTAGCSFLGGETTQTPVDVPPPDGDVNRSAYAAGNTTYIEEKHTTVLRNNAHRINRTVTLTSEVGENKATINDRTTVVVSANRTVRFDRVVDRPAKVRTLSLFRTSNGTIYRAVTDGNTTDRGRVIEESEQLNRVKTYEETFLRALENTSVQHRVVMRNGEVWHRYSADSVSELDAQRLFGETLQNRSVTEYNFTMYVKEGGVIGNARLKITFEGQQRTRTDSKTLVYRLEYREIGTATVDRPAWMNTSS